MEIVKYNLQIDRSVNSGVSFVNLVLTNAWSLPPVSVALRAALCIYVFMYLCIYAGWRRLVAKSEKKLPKKLT
ncbi:hypothetical protein ES703_125709 [subsurface metagenome]